MRWIILVLLAGCSANVTTTLITRDKSGVHISSGKDVQFDSLDWQEPDGTKIAVRGYSSNANVDAITAQRASEAAARADAIAAIKEGVAFGMNAAAKAAGMP